MIKPSIHAIRPSSEGIIIADKFTMECNVFAYCPKLILYQGNAINHVHSAIIVHKLNSQPSNYHYFENV